MKNSRLINSRVIKPGDKNKGRENPEISYTISEIKDTKTDIILHKDGTFEVVENKDSDS